MSVEVKLGVAIVHYDRIPFLRLIIESVLNTVPPGTKVVLCDDGTPNLPIDEIKIPIIRGPNLGVSANKNRALWALQDCTFIAILEDDLYPAESGWLEIYVEACKASEIHHFCRVQDKEVEETVPEFKEFMQKNSFTPIYGSSVRGDFTFLTSTVLSKVGGFNPVFRGAGYAHGSWSNRVVRAGLIGHPLKWIDIKEARDKFKQIGDREGGRWNLSEEELKGQILQNREVFRTLENGPIYHPLVLE